MDIVINTRNWTLKRSFILGCIISANIMLLPKIIFAIPALAFLFFAKKPRAGGLAFLWLIAGGIIPAALFWAF